MTYNKTYTFIKVPCNKIQGGDT